MASNMHNSMAKTKRTFTEVEGQVDEMLDNSKAAGSIQPQDHAGMLKDEVLPNFINDFKLDLTKDAASDLYTGTIVPEFADYLSDVSYWCKIDVANDGAATVNISALGDLAVKKLAANGSVTNTQANDFKADQLIQLKYVFVDGGTSYMLWINVPLERIPSVLPATYVDPVLALSASGSKTLELGTNINPTLTGVFTQNDSGGLTAYRLSRDSVEISTSQSFVDGPLTRSTAGSIVYSAVADYSQGPINQNSLGEDDPVGRIEAGTTAPDTETFNFYVPRFYGVGSIPTNGAGIYAGTKVVASSVGNVVITFPGASNTFMWFAIPLGDGAKTVWYVNELDQGPIGVGELFENLGTFSVTSTGQDVDYTEDLVLYATPISAAPNTFTFKP